MVGIRFIFSFIGIYGILRHIWIELEKMQFGADVFASSWVDTFVCAIVAFALSLILLLAELNE